MKINKNYKIIKKNYIFIKKFCSYRKFERCFENKNGFMSLNSGNRDMKDDNRKIVKTSEKKKNHSADMILILVMIKNKI